MTDEPGFRMEEVDAVPTPPRARAEDADAAEVGGGRSRDYLDGFLASAPPPVAAGEVGGPLYEMVIEALKDIYDPEIPVNLYDLGLIYGVDVAEGGQVVITMTLTTPHCPVAESMPGEVELRVSAVPGVSTCDVNLVWDPPWDPAKMSDEARLELGML